MIQWIYYLVSNPTDQFRIVPSSWVRDRLRFLSVGGVKTLPPVYSDGKGRSRVGGEVG